MCRSCTLTEWKCFLFIKTHSESWTSQGPAAIGPETRGSLFKFCEELQEDQSGHQHQHVRADHYGLWTQAPSRSFYWRFSSSETKHSVYTWGPMLGKLTDREPCYANFWLDLWNPTQWEGLYLLTPELPRVRDVGEGISQAPNWVAWL